MSVKQTGSQETSPGSQLPGADLRTRLMSEFGVSIDPELLVQALTHRSFAHEHGDVPTNERMEFLGDAVLGLVAAEELYRNYPDRPESELTQMRAAIVSQKPLAEIARELGVGQFILLGRGEHDNGGGDKDSILSDTVEALIGATYINHGSELAGVFVRRLIGDRIMKASEPTSTVDPKTALIEYCNSHELPSPEYQVTSVGPAHALRFTATVNVNGISGKGEGTAKKHAEKAAAIEILNQIQSGA